MSYIKLEALENYTSKILPSVYGESLSYSELLGKMVDYLNTSLINIDEFNTTLNEFLAKYNDTAVQVINDLLKAMIDDGRFNTYLDGQLSKIDEINTALVPFKTEISDARGTEANLSDRLTAIVALINAVDSTLTITNNNVSDNTSEIIDIKADITNNNKAFAEATGEGIVNGLNVLQQSSPNMTVLISPGTAHLFNGKRYELLENATTIIDTPNPLYPRIDIIYINSVGVLTYGKGEATSNPIAPTPVNGLMLAEIYVDKTDLSVVNSMITDKRKMKNNIDGLKSIIDTHDVRIDTHDVRIDTHDVRIDTHEVSIDGLKSIVDTHEIRIDTHDSQMAERVKNITVDLLSPQYGIKGDGTDEHAKIQAVFDMVESWGGGKITVPTSPSGTYGLNDTVWIGANITLEFIGNSYFKLLKPTTTGTIILNKPNATNIVFINPLLDGGGTGIIIGSSGQNGIGVVNSGRVQVYGGHIRNCARGFGDPADGGKGIQVENSKANFLAVGTVIENCHKAISSHKSITPDNGNISVKFDNIHAKNCDQFSIFHQTNGTDTTGIRQNILVSNFTIEDCGSVDGVFVFSRCHNAQFINGKIIGTTPTTAIIRGRHSRTTFKNIDIHVNADSIIDISPSYYGLDEGIAELNEYQFNLYGTYNYLVKSDPTGVTYPNRPLQKSRISGYTVNDASISLIEPYSKHSSTRIDMMQGENKRYIGTSEDLVNYYGNKFANINNAYPVTLLNSWKNYNPITTDLFGIYKEGDVNIVCFKGTLNNGTGPELFILPVNYRPLKTLYHPASYYESTSASWKTLVLTINPDGNVLIYGTIPTGLTMLSLGNVRFRAEQ